MVKEVEHGSVETRNGLVGSTFIETKLPAWHVASFCSTTYKYIPLLCLRKSFLSRGCTSDALPEIVLCFPLAAQINVLSSKIVVKIAWCHKIHKAGVISLWFEPVWKSSKQVVAPCLHSLQASDKARSPSAPLYNKSPASDSKKLEARVGVQKLAGLF